jgi:acetyltransferase-like isoleucine patch superfamily enzyme
MFRPGFGLGLATASMEGRVSELKEVALAEYPDATVGKNVVVRAARFVTTGRFVLGDDVSITAQVVELGDQARIERGTTVRGLGKPMDGFRIGDESMIGFSCQILCPTFEMGDYTQLHNTALASGYQPLTIGHNCWIGQNTILNCTERLSLGNNVRIGTQSQLWTHVASGELLEGCTLFGSRPLVLEDNVWVVGGAVISPGLVLKRNAVIMVGSVMTRSAEAFHTYAGVPAADVTAKINAWKPVTAQEKWDMLRGYGKEFLEAEPRFGGMIGFYDLAMAVDRERFERAQSDPALLVVLRSGDLPPLATASNCRAGVFALDTKQYLKRRSDIEKAWIKFLVGYRARFIPLADP